MTSIDRRTAILQMGALAGATLLTERLAGEAAPGIQAPAASPSAPFTLPPLPYAYDALEPYFDAETMHLHHDKHSSGLCQQSECRRGRASGTGWQNPRRACDQLGQPAGVGPHRRPQQRRRRRQPLLLVAHSGQGPNRPLRRTRQSASTPASARFPAFRKSSPAPPCTSSAAVGPGWSRCRMAL